MTDGWVNLDPTPVPEEDPRVRSATLVADGAWLRSEGDTAAARVRDVVRAVIAHLDDIATSASPLNDRDDTHIDAAGHPTEHRLVTDGEYAAAYAAECSCGVVGQVRFLSEVPEWHARHIAQATETKEDER